MRKVFERLLYDRLVQFFNSNSVFCKEQFSFRKGMSTIDAIAQMINDIEISFLNREKTSAVFIDLKETFDKVNNQFLIFKLERYEIRGLHLALIRNYLADRTQNVSSGEFYSFFRTIEHGVRVSARPIVVSYLYNGSAWNLQEI